jgi:perosamine synthetase
MTDIHAAIGRVQLRKLHRANLLRRENAKYLSENLEGVVVPVEEFGYTHVYHQYTIRVVDHDRDRFAQELEKLGVGSGVYYPTPVHKLPSFNKDFDLKKTKTACKQVLSLPVHPKLSMRDLHKIVKAVNQVAKAGS